MKEPQTPCSCEFKEGGFWCERYQVPMGPGTYNLCSGKDCLPAKSQAYREKCSRNLDRKNNPTPRRSVPLQTVAVGPSTATKSQPKKTKPKTGSGTKLKNLLSSLGFSTAGCADGCGGFVALMDKAGVQGCKLAVVRDAVVKRLRGEQNKLGWLKKIKAGMNFPLELVGKVNLFDPAPGLYDEAVRQAEAELLLPAVGQLNADG